jgi:hypothetical protein
MFYENLEKRSLKIKVGVKPGIIGNIRRESTNKTEN